MNQLTKILGGMALGFFIIRLTVYAVFNAPPANNALIYLASFIILLMAGAMIDVLKKDFFTDYLQRHYKNPRLFIGLAAGACLGLVFAFLGKISWVTWGVWLYFLVSFLYLLETRLAAFFSLVLLSYAAVFYIGNQAAFAETLAFYAVCFLAITLFTAWRQSRLTDTSENA